MREQRAVVFFPKGNGLHVIESLRRRFDPLASEIAAHATLVFPFTSGISDVDLCVHVEQVVKNQPPFRARFEGVAEVEEEYLFLDAVVGAERLRDLHDGLYRGLLSEYRSTEHVYRPHITLGRIRDGAARTAALHAARQTSPIVDETVASVHVFRLGEKERMGGPGILLQG